MSSIAVPEVIPKISRSKPGLFCKLGGEDEVEESESPFVLDCRASRYLCPTFVRTRPFGVNPFIVLAIGAVVELE